MTISADKTQAREAARHSDGTFGEQHLPEPAGLTGGLDNSWGATPMVRPGSHTPWGAASHVNDVAEGVVFVSTPSHGGFKVSRERNAAIPSALRNPSGWYEEDVEANIVVAVHGADVAPHRSASDAVIRGEAWDEVRNWMPDAYEKATGLEATADNSWVRRQQADKEAQAQFRAAHAHEFVSTGWGSDANGTWVPEGYRVVSARVDADGRVGDFLVPEREAISDSALRPNILISPSKHIDVTEVAALQAKPTRHRPMLRGDELGVSMSKLSPAQQRRASAELDHMYRWSDGSVATMRERLEADGVVSKHHSVVDGKTRYRVENPDGTVYPVSKATYDALDGVPEDVSDLDRLRGRYLLAEHRRRTRREPATRDSEAKFAALREEYRTAQAAADDEYRAQAAHTQWMRREAMRRLLAEHGLAVPDYPDTDTD